MIQLRPHHLIDIIRNIGQDRPVVPHPFGHAQHIITKAILDGTDREIRFVIGADDLCKPCIHLKSDGMCDDILPQLAQTVWKQHYNDTLDHKLLHFLNLEEGSTLVLNDFLRLIASDIDALVQLCTHPGESKESRLTGLIRGMERLGESGK